MSNYKRFHKGGYANTDSIKYPCALLDIYTPTELRQWDTVAEINGKIIDNIKYVSSCWVVKS